MSLSASIVVPTYNEEKYIRNLLESVKSQTVQPVEVILVDASEDQTRQIAGEYGVTVLNQDVRRVSWARKRGFAAAKGDIVISTDADTILDEHFVEACLSAFRQNPNLTAALGPAWLSGGPRLFRLFARYLFPLFLRLSLVIGRPNLNGFNFAARKTDYLKAGEFNDQLVTGEDIELGARLSRVGKVSYVPSMLVFTSARRIEGMGGFKFMLHHTLNFLRVLAGRQSSSDFKPYR